MIFTTTGLEMDCVRALHELLRNPDSGVSRTMAPQANMTFERIIGAFGLSRRGSESSNQITVTLEINEGPDLYSFSVAVEAYEPP